MKKKEQIKLMSEEIASLNSRNKALTHDINNFIETIGERNEEISLLKNDLKAEIDDVTKETLLESEEVVKLYHRFSESQVRNAALIKEIEERDDHIKLLEAHTRELDTAINELRRKLNSARQTAFIEWQISLLKHAAEPANYREELKKLKDENEELKSKLKNLERGEIITNASTEVIDILETELRNTTKKYSILKEAFIKIRDIATSL